MTSNHLLVYRLAELMFEHEQQILPVDLLFDDEQIGDFSKSIQIDSPYQQMLLEGVLTETIREEKLCVCFTVEGYFHFVLGEVIYNRTEGLGAEVLKQIVEENKLKGAKEGVEQCLIRDVQKNELNRLIWLIDRCESYLSLFTLPLSNIFFLAGFQNNSTELFKDIIEKLLKRKTESDLIVLENVMVFFIESQRHQLYMSLALCIFETKLPKNTRSIKLKLHALKYIDKAIRKTEIDKIYRQLRANKSNLENASNYIELGLGYRLISKYKAALSCFRIALELSDNIKNQITIKCHVSLGLIYSNLGNYSLSLEHHNIALSMTRKIYGKDYFGAYISCLQIGSILHLIDHKNIKKSINYLIKGLDLAIRHLGSKHTEVATIYNNLGITYAKNKDNSNAENSYLKAYEIFHFIYPKNSPWIATVSNNLASLYSNIGELEKAQAFQKDAIDIIIYNYGEYDVMTAITRSTYAKILILLNRKKEAIEQYQKTIKTFKKKLPNDHIYLQKAHSNLGVVYMENGTFSLAITCFLNSLKVLDYHGDKYLNKKLELINWITKCYQELGNLKKAEFFNKMKNNMLDTLNDR